MIHSYTLGRNVLFPVVARPKTLYMSREATECVPIKLSRRVARHSVYTELSDN